MMDESQIIDDIFASMGKDLSFKVPKHQTETKIEAERKLEQARSFTFRYGLLADKTLGQVIDDPGLWGVLDRVKKTTKSQVLKRKITLVAQAKLTNC
jgi:hypothetical protein